MSAPRGDAVARRGPGGRHLTATALADRRRAPWPTAACALAALLALAAPGAGATDDEGMGDERPVASFDVCYDFGCKSRRTLYLFDEDWRAVRAVMGGARTPGAERERIARAIGVIERIVGTLTPTGNDRAGNSDAGGTRGQMDCIDESLNTTRYLSVLEDKGLMRFHRVVERAYRAPLILDQHWAAQIEETATGERWAVDSWVRANGEPAVVQALGDWQRDRDPPALAARR